MKVLQNLKNGFAVYLLKFAAVFCACYFGTLAVIGLSAPGGYYSNVIHNYFDYISCLRTSLLYVSKWVLSVLGYDTYVESKYLLKIKDGAGVTIVYSCLGFGVMSFWVAFIVANKGTVIKKIKWIFGGMFLIWMINITRISLLLLSINNHWPIPFFNHHTWFNILAYIMIFILIYFYDRSHKQKGVADDISAPRITLTAKKDSYL